ncbi:MAG: protein tyrosine phosphatase family protein [Heteroscytonema crispum UTEX LB 1556]
MSKSKIEDIYNFLKISDRIATSGQPTQEQFTAIKESGYQVVVNLALAESPNALPDEKQIVETQGMQYVHIPVMWENPTLENVTDFFKVMEANTTQKVFIHCAANMRVSAFMYLYRRIHQGINHEDAKKDLNKMWVPNEIWQKFIEQVIANS